jgi:hypothetical protein
VNANKGNGRDVYATVIAREGGRSSIPETLMMESKGRGVLDAPPSRGMTIVGPASRSYIGR